VNTSIFRVTIVYISQTEYPLNILSGNKEHRLNNQKHLSYGKKEG
jgi:hypothetical protein